ncbi:MAG: histidine ammonia-lyase [Thermoplasmataceae archaeon]|jgi:histidine ammonia-lyase
MIEIDGNSLTVESVLKVALGFEEVKISEKALPVIDKSREVVEDALRSGRGVYGVNTGFGSLLNVRIDGEKAVTLQENLIRSHSAGIGDPLSEEFVRAIMLVRANSLIRGFSGVRKELIDKIVESLNRKIYPYVPEYGSVGASGDLAPLAHIALALMGEGYCISENMKTGSAVELMKKGISPLRLKEKEGVSFINGTSAIAGLLSVEIGKSYNILENALGSAAISMEALRGTILAFDDSAIAARKHKGQSTVASIIRKLLEGSKNIEKSSLQKIQDAYSLRCIPQVYGAVLDTINYATGVLTDEINSTTDNPLVCGDRIISAGNFHGEPVAFIADFLAIALTDMGNMIERRIARLTDSSLSGLPPFLTKDYGLNSGLMIVQYAAAALCNMNKVLAHPASSDSIPTSANQEDHVSMGMNSALKLSKIVENVERIVAMEYLAANQGLYFVDESISPGVNSIVSAIRDTVSEFKTDRSPNPDVENIIKLMRSPVFRNKLKNSGSYLVPWL